MSKIKDYMEEKQIFSNKELEANEPKGYKFDEENHYHSLNDKLLLGCSTVVGVLAKPLTWWASGLAVAKLGWINSKIKIDGKYTNIPLETRLNAVLPQLEAIKKMSGEEFITLLDEAYKAHSVKLDKSADEGTDLHAELEKYVKNWMLCKDPQNKGGDMIDKTIYNERIIPFITWVEENVDKFLWSEGNVFSERMWTGGIFDVIFQLKNGKICIGDFKSSKEAYISQFIQIAGYDIQQSENGVYTKDGVKVLNSFKIDAYYVFPFGAEKFTVDFRYNVDELKEGFKSCVILHKLTNK